jgi:hypothetical protein
VRRRSSLRGFKASQEKKALLRNDYLMCAKLI